MARCEVCGNEYDKPFDVIMAGTRHTFDSFECAVHRLAPLCEHCQCRILGRGVEASGSLFCCAHCARRAGADLTPERDLGPFAETARAGK